MLTLQVGEQRPLDVVLTAASIRFCHRRFVHELLDRNLAITEVFGTIGNLSVSATKFGHAGVEATFRFNTPAERIVVEILGWYEHGRFITGLTLYDRNKSPVMQRNKTVILSNPQEMLVYEVIGHPAAGIHTVIKTASGTKLLDDVYECKFTKIVTFQTELEYYRSSALGSFNFDGTVTLNQGYDPSIGYIALGPACSFYEDRYIPNVPCFEFLDYNHYASGGSWIMNGIIRDP